MLTRHIIWSMANLDKMKVRCQNQTNCILERYNRAVNELFPNRRPNLLQFAAGILKEAQERTTFLIGGGEITSEHLQTIPTQN